MTKSKSVLYAKEQDEISNKLIKILNLDEENSSTLYELDNNIEKQNKINNLIPDIKKYFNCNNVISINYTEKCKRPFLSIIKFVLKNKYKILVCEERIKIDNNIVRTTRYIFSEK
jgi:hypothetical protein